MKIASLLLLTCLMASCGKAPSMKDQYNGKSAEPLVGKNNSEIMNLKYKNEIYLNCSVRIVNGTTIDSTVEPADSFSWYIPGELSLMRFLNYKIDNRETITAVRMASQLQFLDSVTHTSESGKEYYMEHAPVLKIIFRRDSRSILSNGSIHEKDTFSEKLLFENVETTLFTKTTDSEEDGVITEDLRCTLKTMIEPQYNHQWKVVR